MTGLSGYPELRERAGSRKNPFLCFSLFRQRDCGAVQADRRALNITLNSIGTELTRDDRRRLYSNFGLLYPHGHMELAAAEDFDQIRSAMEKCPPYQAIFNKVCCLPLLSLSHPDILVLIARHACDERGWVVCARFGPLTNYPPSFGPSVASNGGCECHGRWGVRSRV